MKRTRARSRRGSIMTKLMNESRGENGEGGNESNENSIIEISEESPSTGKHKRSPNGTRKKQVTLSKLEKSIRDLAIAEHNYLCIYIATQNSFHNSATKASFSWKHLEKDIASHEKLKKLMEQVLKMWKGVSSMTGTVANKARKTIGDVLGLSGMKKEDIAEAGGEGDEDISLPFISGDLDIKNETFNKNKPFGHHFFLRMYHLFFTGNNPDRVHYFKHFKNSPLPLLALIATVILDGVHSLLLGNWRPPEGNNPPNEMGHPRADMRMSPDKCAAEVNDWAHTTVQPILINSRAEMTGRDIGMGPTAGATELDCWVHTIILP
ncbi:hypothetical protein C8R48DRAFT_676684 [Suillus tomentosus]|nr:hypothetical protein C8R48DRAFT_676684 [Suillus tomentosus]